MSRAIHRVRENNGLVSHVFGHADIIFHGDSKY